MLKKYSMIVTLNALEQVSLRIAATIEVYIKQMVEIFKLFGVSYDRAIRFKSSQICCGLYATIPHTLNRILVKQIVGL